MKVKRENSEIASGIFMKKEFREEKGKERRRQLQDKVRPHRLRRRGTNGHPPCDSEWPERGSEAPGSGARGGGTPRAR